MTASPAAAPAPAASPVRAPFHLGIRAKLLVTILLLTIIPMGFLGWQAFNEQKRVITEEVTRSHQELSNLLAHGIYENLEATRRLMSAITDLDLIKALNPVAAEDFLQSLLKNYPIFKLIYLVDSSRRIMVTTDPRVALPADWSFTNAVKRSYQGSLSDVFKTPEGSPYMTLESIIKSPDKGVIGVLVAEVDLNYIRDLLKNALKRSKSQGLVLDETGAIIAQSSPEVKTFRIAGAELLDSDVTTVRDIEGERYLITAVSLKKFDFYQAPNWTIVLQIPEKQAFQAAFELRQRILSLLIATALVSLTLAVLMANSFIGPLLNLIAGARFIAAGDFTREIQPTSHDEIGDLTRTFEEMRTSLRTAREDLDRRINELDTLYKVGKDISSILDFTQLQNSILEKVVKVVRAERGSLMLLDETEKVLTIGVAVGLTEEIQREARVGLGEPVAGYVMETQQPLFVEDVERDQAFLAIKRTNITRGTLMCVPLRAKDKMLGVLNVSRSEPNSFTERDFHLFQSLATQASIAIENARLYRYAVTDEMTRLYNHRYFQQRLDEELQRADRYDSKVSLILLDVDHFKKFNDTYGHQEGDRVLKTVSRLLEKSIREVDIPARYGGEEFVVICPEKDAEGAMVPAQRIRTAIETYDFRINGVRVPLTVSLGVACYPDQARNKFDLILFADTALYTSKESGRNRATIYSPSMRTEEVLARKAAKKKAQEKEDQ